MSYISYFLTGNTAQGHISLIQDALKSITYLFTIEGPYLSDNCIMMERLYESLQQQNEIMELIHHPSAPNSLQGILFPRTKLAIISFTPENRLSLEHFEGQILTLNLYDFYNIEKMTAKQEEIDKLTTSIIELHRDAYRGYAKALAIHDEWEKIYIDQSNFQAANAYSEHLAKRLLPERKVTNSQQPIYRFLGAATPLGAVDFVPKLTAGLKRYLIKGRPGSGKSTLLRKLVARGKELGYELEIYQCGLDPKSLDMVICRELGFAIFDSTAPHEYEPTMPEDEVIDMYEISINPDTDERFKNELQDVAARYRTQMKLSTASLAEAAKLEAKRASLTKNMLDKEGIDVELNGLITSISELLMHS